MKLNTIAFSSILVSLILLSSSCATIFTGTKQKILFTSNPEGASVYVNGQQVVTTPGSAKVKKGKTQDILIKKDGFRDYNTILSNRKYHWTVWLNIVTLDLGWVIDGATGAAEKYTSNEISGELIKKPEQVTSSAPISLDDLKNTVINEVGNKTYKGKPRGKIFIDEVALNLNSYKQIVLSELKSVGFTTGESTELVISPTIIDLSHNLDQRKDRFLASSSLTVEWVVKSQNNTLLTLKTDGIGTWPASGNNSVELAFKACLYKFLLSKEFYEISGAN